MVSNRRWVGPLLLTLVLLWACSLYLTKTNLFLSDLGRHVTNGKVIWQTKQVFQTNLYSYTTPDFAVPNHHWLFGALIYPLHVVGGFPLVTLAIAVVYMLGLSVVAVAAARRSGSVPTALALFLLLPLVSFRTETRPEAFTSLGVALTLVTCLWLWRRRSRWHTTAAMVALAAYMVVWANSHIFYVSGIGLAGFYLVRALLSRSKRQSVVYATLVGALILAAGLNPNTWRLWLYPFQIFHDYQYPVAENMPLFFMMTVQFQPIYILIGSISAVLATLSLLKIRHADYDLQPAWLYELLTACGVLLFIRFSTLLTPVAVLLLAATLAEWAKVPFMQKVYSGRWWERPAVGAGTIVALLGYASLIIFTGVHPFSGWFGLGTIAESEQSGAFFQEHHLRGPIFNDYDIGGFLIYTLYPQEKVFIDNRPEAYPGSFMKDVSVDAQKDETIWREVDNDYRFNVIYFNRNDATSWAVPFLNRRLEDPDWTLVYADDHAVILVRNTPENKTLIDQYRIK